MSMLAIAKLPLAFRSSFAKELSAGRSGRTIKNLCEKGLCNVILN